MAATITEAHTSMFLTTEIYASKARRGDPSWYVFTPGKPVQTVKSRAAARKLLVSLATT